MLVRAPTVTGAMSPRRTAPYQIDTSSASRTSPQSAAPAEIIIRAPSVGSFARYRSKIARGKRARSSPIRASRAPASANGPSTTVTEVATVATVLPSALRADEPELPQARRLLDVDRLVVGEA